MATCIHRCHRSERLNITFWSFSMQLAALVSLKSVDVFGRAPSAQTAMLASRIALVSQLSADASVSWWTTLLNLSHTCAYVLNWHSSLQWLNRIFWLIVRLNLRYVVVFAAYKASSNWLLIIILLQDVTAISNCLIDLLKVCNLTMIEHLAEAHATF